MCGRCDDLSDAERDLDEAEETGRQAAISGKDKTFNPYPHFPLSGVSNENYRWRVGFEVGQKQIARLRVRTT